MHTRSCFYRDKSPHYRMPVAGLVHARHERFAVSDGSDGKQWTTSSDKSINTDPFWSQASNPGIVTIRLLSVLKLSRHIQPFAIESFQTSAHIKFEDTEPEIFHTSIKNRPFACCQELSHCRRAWWLQFGQTANRLDFLPGTRSFQSCYHKSRDPSPTYRRQKSAAFHLKQS